MIVLEPRSRPSSANTDVTALRIVLRHAVVFALFVDLLRPMLESLFKDTWSRCGAHLRLRSLACCSLPKALIFIESNSSLTMLPQWAAVIEVHTDHDALDDVASATLEAKSSSFALEILISSRCCRSRISLCSSKSPIPIGETLCRLQQRIHDYSRVLSKGEV